MRLQFLAQVLCKSEEGEFADAVSASVGISGQARHRANGKNMPGTCSDHPGEEGPCEVICAEEVYGQHGFKCSIRFIRYITGNKTTCIVHEHINRIAIIQHPLPQKFRLILSTQVESC